MLLIYINLIEEEVDGKLQFLDLVVNQVNKSFHSEIYRKKIMNYKKSDYRGRNLLSSNDGRNDMYQHFFFRNFCF